ETEPKKDHGGTAPRIRAEASPPPLGDTSAKTAPPFGGTQDGGAGRLVEAAIPPRPFDAGAKEAPQGGLLRGGPGGGATRPEKGPGKVLPDASPPSSSSTYPSSKSPSEVGGKKLAEWKKDLMSRDPSVRVEAILAIPHFGDASAEAVPLLIDRTNDLDV